MTKTAHELSGIQNKEVERMVLLAKVSHVLVQEERKSARLVNNWLCLLETRKYPSFVKAGNYHAICLNSCNFTKTFNVSDIYFYGLLAQVCIK
jgi:hypothetical protein